MDEVSEVTVPQMRLLFAVHDHGQASCTELAHALGLNGSSVTRLADKLTVSGHLVRTGAQDSRSKVVLELTQRGHEVIDAVLAWRSRELTRVLHHLDADALRSLTASLDLLHDGLRRRHHDLTGPVPL
ncbi:MarR family transcriptional regulator [Microlunatus elymi]|uniref:MarR family transcriptional regulator n=1 Tax=Microlunatus elymi TaxID=2596828 RepID=A0A516Q4P1_9ACTN|nr:MarR family transcriptional regulator [Microlunatus elymi]QDP98406.1 MarR family transcriptional regulator [Microlunatus elymi]